MRGRKNSERRDTTGLTPAPVRSVDECYQDFSPINAPLKVNLDRNPVGCLQSGMRFLPLYLAMACSSVFVALDVLVRFRLRKVGEQTRPFRGGLFNQAKYLRLRKRHHWSGWPVYLSWMVWLAGIVLWLLNLLYNTVPLRAGF